MARPKKRPAWCDEFLEHVRGRDKVAPRTDKYAALLCGIDPSTPAKYAERDPGFVKELTRARAERTAKFGEEFLAICMRHAKEGSVWHFKVAAAMVCREDMKEWFTALNEAEPNRQPVDLATGPVKFGDLLWDAENGGFRKGGKKGKK